MDREDILDSLYADDTPSLLSFPASAPIPNLLNGNLANAGNTFEKTKQTQYLKPNNLSTAIIDQAMRRSRIRHSRGSIALSRKDYPTLFLYHILTFEQTNQTQYLKLNNL